MSSSRPWYRLCFLWVFPRRALSRVASHRAPGLANIVLGPSLPSQPTVPHTVPHRVQGPWAEVRVGESLPSRGSLGFQFSHSTVLPDHLASMLSTLERSRQEAWGGSRLSHIRDTFLTPPASETVSGQPRSTRHAKPASRGDPVIVLVSPKESSGILASMVFRSQ